MKEFRIQPGLHTQPASQANKPRQAASQQPASQHFSTVLNQSIEAHGRASTQATQATQAMDARAAVQRLGADAGVKQELAGAEVAYDNLLKMQSQLSQLYHQLNQPKTGGDQDT